VIELDDWAEIRRLHRAVQSAEMVAAAILTIFAQPDAAAVADQLDSIAGKLGRQFPAVEAMLREAAPDICSFANFPSAHGGRSGAPTPWSESTRRSSDRRVSTLLRQIVKRITVSKGHPPPAR